MLTRSTFAPASRHVAMAARLTSSASAPALGTGKEVPAINAVSHARTVEASKAVLARALAHLDTLARLARVALHGNGQLPMLSKFRGRLPQVGKVRQGFPVGQMMRGQRITVMG